VTSAPSKVLCLVEHDNGVVLEASLRALSFARSLAHSSDDSLVAVIFGETSDLTVSTLGTFGVDQVHSVRTSQLASFAPLGWAQSLVQLTTSLHANALVASGTDRGNEVLAHVGALMDLPMVANCFSATRLDEGSVRVSRQRWAGSLIEEARLEATPALLSVAFDGVMAEGATSPVTTAQQIFEPHLDDEDLLVHVAQWQSRGSGISLADARVVIGGGRGVGSAEGFAPLEELAELLGGAVGVSRAVTSLGWRPHNQQVGQTGTRISPDLYLVSGISGATQHLAGCQSAKRVVAINTDPDAPIISRADFAVIGDLNVVIPALVEAIRARQG